MKKIILTFGILGLMFFSVNLMAKSTVDKKNAIVVKANGLVCDFCAIAFKKVFKKQKSVDKIDVSLKSGEIFIYLKKGKTLDDKIIKKLVIDAGYSLEKITRPKVTKKRT